MEVLQEYLNFALQSGAYLGSAFVIFIIGRLFLKLTKPNINVIHELVEKDNLAFSVTYVGYFIGLVLAIGSAIVGPSINLLTDVQDIFIYGLLAIILLNLSSIINDKVILNKFSIKQEIIEDQNVGTGVVEAANYIGSGLIIFGSVSGETFLPIAGVLSAVIFWTIGQVLLIITAKIYQLITPYDIHHYIEKDNVAVGIGFAGALIAIANIIRFGLSGDAEDLEDVLLDTGFEFLLGLLMIPIARFFTDKLLLPGRKLTDELINQEKPNNGAALIEAFAYIGSSVLICWCL